MKPDFELGGGIVLETHGEIQILEQAHGEFLEAAGLPESPLSKPLSTAAAIAEHVGRTQPIDKEQRLRIDGSHSVIAIMALQFAASESEDELLERACKVMLEEFVEKGGRLS